MARRADVDGSLPRRPRAGRGDPEAQTLGGLVVQEARVTREPVTREPVTREPVTEDPAVEDRDAAVRYDERAAENASRTGYPPR